ncbi:MAG: DUF3332 domain-containing protein [Muribaculaceae bacterium]|nr:DUF3332 domain-containing protein [Muribaculaceae bacterium]
MKKNLIPIALVLAIAGGTLSSCIGSFSLSNKLLAWNNQVGGKAVNELVFIAFWIVPVYEVSFLADFLVINSIEFWSGSNPVASGTRYIDGQDGRYMVMCDGKGYTITSENDGTSMRLDFNTEEQSWSVNLPDGNNFELMTFVDKTHVSMPAADGTRTVVELSDEGLMAYRNEMSRSLWAAK